MSPVGRNEDCPCGSQKKYKKCCGVEKSWQVLLQEAMQLHQAGNLQEARLVYHKVLHKAPQHPDALHLLGVLAFNEGDLQESETLIRQAIQQNPRTPSYYVNLANTLRQAGRIEEAIQTCHVALQLVSNYGPALATLGVLYEEAKDPLQARQMFLESLQVEPDNTIVLSNLGGNFLRQQEFKEAIEYYQKSLKLNRRNPVALHGFGSAMRLMGQFENALGLFREAIQIKPDYYQAINDFALLSLQLNHFTEGFDAYRLRPSGRKDLSLAQRPASWAGKTLSLVHEQGLGDEIFFARFLPFLRALGVRSILYQTNPRMLDFWLQSRLFDQVYAENQIREAEIIVSIADLPFMLGMSDNDQAPPSLKLLPSLLSIQKAEEALKNLPRPLLGLTWQAGEMKISDQGFRALFKAVPLTNLLGSLKEFKGSFVILQRSPEAKDLEQVHQELGPHIADLSSWNQDLGAMFGLLSLLDHMVCVSNTNVHLRALSGKTSHILLPYPPEFRWGFQNSSVWFPDHLLYRQTIEGSWTLALEALTQDLKQL